MQKTRLQNKIKQLMKDLSQLQGLNDKDISNFQHWERSERKYSIRAKRLKTQRITAIAAKVRRYQGWVDSYRHKRLVENN